MEIREGNVIINVDAKMDDGEKELVTDCAIILDAILTTRRLDFKVVSGSALKTILGYICTLLEEKK